MLKSFINRSRNQNTGSNHSNELQKKIDPQAQLDWINNQKVDQGFGVFNNDLSVGQGESGNDVAQMSAKDEVQRKGMSLNSNPDLEKEADVMGVKAANGNIAEVHGKGYGIQKYSGNPVKDMKIRKNRASNLGPGNVRNNGTKYHGGHDLYGKVGDPVYSVKSGKVVKIGNSPSGYGHYVTIKHTKAYLREETFEDGNTKEVLDFLKITYSFYGHLKKTSVKEGDDVDEGTQIGEIGISGNAMGMSGDDVHLHFEYGTEIKASGIIKKESRLSPNDAYDNVSFTSADNNANQSTTGVIKTVYNDDGSVASKMKQDYNTSKQTLIYPLPDKYSKNQY